MRGRFCRKQQVSCRTHYYKCTWDVQSHYLPQEFSHTNFRGLQSCHFIITARCYSQKHKEEQEEGGKGSALWEAWYSRKREGEKEQSGLEKNNRTVERAVKMFCIFWVVYIIFTILNSACFFFRGVEKE